MKDIKGNIVKGHWNVYVKYILFFVLNLIMLNIVLMSGLYNEIQNTRKQLKEIVKSTIIEFDEIDFQHLCTITNCKEIQLDDNTIYVRNEKGVLSKHSAYKFEIIPIVELTEKFNMILDIEEYHLKIVKKYDSRINQALWFTFYINLYFWVVYTIIFVYIEFKSKRRSMLDRLDTSNSLREKNMKILTENIHHELNTPLAIIHGNIRKLEIEMSGYNEITHDRCVMFNFDQTYSAIDQIDNVLQRMSNFKNLKYSNGNKTLKDIFNYSANSMTIYKKSNFEIILDKSLKNYGLKGTLKNGDL
jgi:hypothetical protein